MAFMGKGSSSWSCTDCVIYPTSLFPWPLWPCYFWREWDSCCVECSSVFICLMFPHSSTCVCVQLCPTLCIPKDCNPPGSSVHRVFPGMNTGVGCHSLLRGIFMTQGLHPYLLTSLALAGGFFTTALPRKPDISSWLDFNCASLAETSQRWGCVLYGIITCGAGFCTVPSLDKMAFARLLHHEATLLLSVINMYFYLFLFFFNMYF